MYNIKLKSHVLFMQDMEIKEYYEINKEIKRLEDRKKMIGDRIKKFMENNDFKSYSSQKLMVNVNTVSRKSLDKELLREMGIDEETLELCSKETVYTQLVIR